MPRVPLALIVAVALSTSGGVPHAQTPATNQRVWNGTWEESRFDVVALEEGDPDARGFTMRRYRQGSVVEGFVAHPH